MIENYFWPGVSPVVREVLWASVVAAVHRNSTFETSQLHRHTYH
jgi:hypothetical protein